MYVLLSTSKNQYTIRSLCFIYLTCKWVHSSRLHCQACSQFAAGGALRRGGKGGKKIYGLLFSFLVIYRLAKYRYVFDVKDTALECNFPNGKERNLLALRLRSFNPIQEEEEENQCVMLGNERQDIETSPSRSRLKTPRPAECSDRPLFSGQRQVHLVS